MVTWVEEALFPASGAMEEISGVIASDGGEKKDIRRQQGTNNKHPKAIPFLFITHLFLNFYHTHETPFLQVTI